MRIVNVAWFSGYLPQGRVSPSFFSPMASLRYRMLLLVEPLHRQGAQAYALHPDAWREYGQFMTKEPEVLVVPKLGAATVEETNRWQAAASEAIAFFKSRGTRVVADFCDFHFDTPVIGPFQSWLVSEADSVIVATDALAAMMTSRFGVVPEVIGDPYEGAPAKPAFDLPRKRSSVERLLRMPPGTCRLLWFGHPSNFASLHRWMENFNPAGSDFLFSLDIVTTITPEIEATVRDINGRYGGKLSVSGIPWSVEAVWNALARCHIVVIPTQVSDPSKAVKSPNRVVEAIHAGRFVVANPLPSYQAFSEWIWLGAEIEDGIFWFLTHMQEARQKLYAAQDYIEQHHAPDAIAQRWLHVFLNVL